MWVDLNNHAPSIYLDKPAYAFFVHACLLLYTLHECAPHFEAHWNIYTFMCVLVCTIYVHVCMVYYILWLHMSIDVHVNPCMLECWVTVHIPGCIHQPELIATKVITEVTSSTQDRLKFSAEHERLVMDGLNIGCSQHNKII